VNDRYYACCIVMRPGFENSDKKELVNIITLINLTSDQNINRTNYFTDPYRKLFLEYFKCSRKFNKDELCSITNSACTFQLLYLPCALQMLYYSRIML